MKLKLTKANLSIMALTLLTACGEGEKANNNISNVEITESDLENFGAQEGLTYAALPLQVRGLDGHDMAIEVHDDFSDNAQTFAYDSADGIYPIAVTSDDGSMTGEAKISSIASDTKLFQVDLSVVINNAEHASGRVSGNLTTSAKVEVITQGDFEGRLDMVRAKKYDSRVKGSWNVTGESGTTKQVQVDLELAFEGALFSGDAIRRENLQSKFREFAQSHRRLDSVEARRALVEISKSPEFLALFENVTASGTVSVDGKTQSYAKLLKTFILLLQASSAISSN